MINYNKMMFRKFSLGALTSLMLLFTACDKNNNINIFSIKDDQQLGLQVSEEISNNPSEYPILERAAYPEAYAYLDNIVQDILSSKEIAYRDEFAWKVHIIDDDVLNAFAVPGGYIYVYTGLIKYLDKEDDLAGVLAHEIAHVDQRHSTQQLQSAYGLDILLSVVLGNNPGQLKEIAGALAGNLASLSFSRKHETEADEYSVYYLSETEYQCNGAYSFFQKLIDSEQAGNTPTFLSTHPDPADRIEDINATAKKIGCDTTPLAPDTYQTFKEMLPN